MRNESLKPILLVISLFFVGMLFQNCSDVSFEAAVYVSNKNTLEIGDPIDGDNPLPPDDDNPLPPDGDNPLPPDGDYPLPPDDGDDPGDGKKNKKYACGIENIDDILVNIISLTSNGGTRLAVNDGTGERSLISMSEGFAVIPSNTASASQLRLVLAGSGNVLVDADGNLFELKTPSGQTSGLKINMNGQFLFESGNSYRVTFALDPATQVHRAGKKCILKPVFKSTSIVEF